MVRALCVCVTAWLVRGEPLYVFATLVPSAVDAGDAGDRQLVILVMRLTDDGVRIWWYPVPVPARVSDA